MAAEAPGRTQAAGQFAEGARRFAEPFVELWEDLCGEASENASLILRGAVAFPDDAAAASSPRQQSACSPFSLLGFALGVCEARAAAAMLTATSCFRGALCGLAEVARDLDVPSPALPVTLALLASPTGSAAVVLSGVSVPLRCLSVIAGIVLSLCAVSALKQFPYHSNRGMQVTAAYALGSCAIGHAMLSIGVVPDGLCRLALSPGVFLHHALDMVFNPLLLANLARLAGMAPNEVPRALSALLLSSMCFAGSTIASAPITMQLLFMATGTTALYTAAKQVAMLPEMAAEVSPHNRDYVMHVGDRVLFLWLCHPVAQALMLLGLVMPNQALGVCCVLDIVGKTWVMHLIFRNRMAFDTAIAAWRSRRPHTAQHHGGRRPNREWASSTMFLGSPAGTAMSSSSHQVLLPEPSPEPEPRCVASTRWQVGRS